MPDFIAALVAFSASSIRSFFSFKTISVSAPILIWAIPPKILAIRSSSFSLSYSLVVFNNSS